MRPESENLLIVPSSYNYIGVFLTLGCNLSCSYCINHLTGKAKARPHLKAKDWIHGINKIQFSSSEKIALTLQGGEPTIHPDFYEIVNGIDSRFDLDLLTNAQFDVATFAQNISPKKFSRSAPYAPIRISFHPETMDLNVTLEKILELTALGFKVGLYSVTDSRFDEILEQAKTKTKKLGIDYRFKDLLGNFENKLLGEYKYPDAVGSQVLKKCLCKTTELLIAPDGNIHRCHHDLYNQILPLGNIAKNHSTIQDIYRECSFYGNCNPCDVKLKNNRNQSFGHTSVDIVNLEPL